jgi:hypothetical protein
MRSFGGCLGGCLAKLLLGSLVALVFVWALTLALNPWALRIGGRSTPLLYWHGTGTVVSKDGKAYPLYVSFWPGRPQGFHYGIGRREGKTRSARLSGTGWLCIAPGTMQRLKIGGTMYGGYLSDAESLLAFRLLEWQRPFAINYQRRGYFDLAGTWHGPDLVLDRPDEQGSRFNTGPFIDHATGTLHWSTYDEFESACRNTASPPQPKTN